MEKLGPKSQRGPMQKINYSLGMKEERCYCSRLSKMAEVRCRKTHMHPKGRAHIWRLSPLAGWPGWKQQPAAGLLWEREDPLLHKNLNSRILDDWSHQMPLRVCPSTSSLCPPILAKDFLGVLGPGNGKLWKGRIAFLRESLCGVSVGGLNGLLLLCRLLTATEGQTTPRVRSDRRLVTAN